MHPDARTIRAKLESLCGLAHECARRGWVPATSGNFSMRETATGHIYISRSGVDKGVMAPDDLLEVDAAERVVAGEGRPSAETGLHLEIYKARPHTHVIAHVHTIWNTLISARAADAGHVEIAGYELLKALSGVTTHALAERVPVIANTQDYHALTREMEEALGANPQAHGVLLSAHGLYTWGTSVAEARRHLEALEFLFEVEWRRLTAQKSD
jgi:methylthioribulose-1-phosphate dehydratase